MYWFHVYIGWVSNWWQCQEVYKPTLVISNLWVNHDHCFPISHILFFASCWVNVSVDLANKGLCDVLWETASWEWLTPFISFIRSYFLINTWTNSNFYKLLRSENRHLKQRICFVDYGRFKKKRLNWISMLSLGSNFQMYTDTQIKILRFITQSNV